MNPELRVAVDVGCTRHRVAVGLSEGRLLDEFDIGHDAAGLNEFFSRVERHERQWGLPVAVAMEGYNGYARPLDERVLMHGYRLFNVNNMKLARFKEIFPGPAKSDPIDARKMLEMFSLKDKLPLAREALQEVAPVPQINVQLKALTRRRKQLVNERRRVSCRLQTDLQAVCPGLLDITGEADNLWFLNFLTCRADLTKLKTVRESSLLALQGVGKGYAGKIRLWQKQATFSETVAWVGPMIVEDGKRLLELRHTIGVLQTQINGLAAQSEMACRIDTIPGFGRVCSAELAGEIGSLQRFSGESSLALYVGMAPLNNSSGARSGSKPPRHVNVRAKAAMMIAAAQNAATVPNSRAFYDKKRSQGKTHNQSLRALGRVLVRIIWSMLKQGRDYQTVSPTKTT
ncbi:MAG: IS110 family transposase [Sulfuritalea sp.]|nr:IS110 family transposase [Sulfuritalea sp.]